MWRDQEGKRTLNTCNLVSHQFNEVGTTGMTNPMPPAEESAVPVATVPTSTLVVNVMNLPRMMKTPFRDQISRTSQIHLKMVMPDFGS
jgi:hypothetical protein